jgi:hypothetical protein
MTLTPLLAMSLVAAAPQADVKAAYASLDAGFKVRSLDRIGKLIDPAFVSIARDEKQDRKQYLDYLGGLFGDVKEASFRTDVLAVETGTDGTVATVARRARFTLKEPIPGLPDEIRLTQARRETWRKDAKGWRMIRQEESALERELRQMRDADQKARMGDGTTSPETRIDEITAIDAKHLPRLKEIVAEHGWPRLSRVGTDGANHMWLLVQHMDADIDFQKQCLALMGPQVDKGEAVASEYAYLTDRVRVAEKRFQVYGTQWRRNAKGEFEPHAIEDEKEVDARRKKIGLPTMAEYKKQLEELYNPKG